MSRSSDSAVPLAIRVIWAVAFALPLACKPSPGGAAAPPPAAPLPAQAAPQDRAPAPPPAADAGPPAAPSIAPAPDAAAAAAEAPPPAEPDAAQAAPDAAPADAVEAPRPTIVVKFHNRTGHRRYVGYARWWTENVAVERREGDTWMPVAYEEPMCESACPGGPASAGCAPCLPPTPQPSYRELGDIGEFDWFGAVYDTPPAEPGRCECWVEHTVTPGRYRFSVTLHPAAHPNGPPCPPHAAATPSCVPRRGGEVLGFVSGEPTVARVEFDVTGADQTVDLDVTE